MIHKFTQKGYYIALDVNSGAVHIMDRLAFLLLDYVTDPQSPVPEEAYAALSEYPREEIDGAYSEIAALAESGQLFTPDVYDGYAEKMVASPVKAMCLNVSHDCNLRCEYCFAGKGDYAQGRKMMPVETGIAAIDFLIEQSQGRRELEVDFFGGEPLMNFETVKRVVDYARSKENECDKRFRFTITTNGLLLDDEKTEYINREMHNVVLSLDGRREVNDRVRSRADGRGCYDDVVPKYQSLVRSRNGREYYVRGTFTKYNKDFAADVMEINALGFDQISIEPVVCGALKPYALTASDLPEIFAEYERLSDMLYDARKNGTGFNFFHFMLDLEQGPCAIKRLRGCGCGNEYVAVTPDGDVYPCHQFIGNTAWKMGSLKDGGLDLEMKEMFSKTSVYQKEACRECWAKFYCSGGCNANNMQYEGDVLKPLRLSCELQKKRLECAITLKARQMPQQEDFYA